MKPPHLVAISFAAAVVSAAAPSAVEAEPLPVLMVIANQDFYYREYADTRASLESQGVAVVVAAGTTAVAVSQAGIDPPRSVQPSIALGDASAADYSAIVFVGGWGASSYQYAFPGTYENPAYRPNSAVVAAGNRLINDFIDQDKYVAAICHGVSVLAWARVDGVSPLRGRGVVAWAGGGPGYRLGGRDYPDSRVPLRWQIEANGGRMPLSAAVGDPISSVDDVIVDGRIITAENYASATWLGRVLARLIGTPGQ
jgi:putative intracellular protease/amidase